ncbi:MAG: HEAT repeat domain-containing protein [Cyanobacteriota bacterium]|nr:HEAT repeat domain-containing protein [Cyanobacteriota bacterium]
MNPSLLGVLAAVLVATGLWITGRRPRPLLNSTDAHAVAALNRAQNALVWQARQAAPPTAVEVGAGGAGAEAGSDGWSPRQPLAALPAARLSGGERQAWLRELRRHELAGGPQRLAAMRRARAWGAREVLPLLRRGLRDPDPAVVREAALGMEAFRGRPAAVVPGIQAPAAPRNVARTR